MSSALSASLSGLNDASLRLSVAANRVANALTPGFQAEKVVSSPALVGGVLSAVQPGETSPDLTESLLDAKGAEIAYGANAAVIRAVLRTEEKLLDALT